MSVYYICAPEKKLRFINKHAHGQNAVTSSSHNNLLIMWQAMCLALGTQRKKDKTVSIFQKGNLSETGGYTDGYSTFGNSYRVG